MKPRTQIVVPCYNEEQRLDVETFVAFASGAADIGLVFVDDGSKDRTLAVLRAIAERCPDSTRVLALPENGGKAEAVRQGLLAAMDDGAEAVGYWDADLATPLPVIAEFVETLRRHPEVDLVLGARVALLGRSIERDPFRHYLGRVFATAASQTLNLPVYDTQCGAKLMRVNAVTRALFRDPFNSRWIFDVEMIARYLVARGSAGGLYEQVVPEWTDVGGSKVKPTDFLRAIREMVGIYRRYPLGQRLRGVLVPLTSPLSLYTYVGALGTGIHYLTLIAGVELFQLAPALAAVAGATLGAITNYFFNYHLTFASRKKHRTTFPRFAAIALLGIAVSGLGVRAATALDVNYVLAQAACTIVVLLSGFVLNRAWTFGVRAPEPEPAKPAPEPGKQTPVVNAGTPP